MTLVLRGQFWLRAQVERLTKTWVLYYSVSLLFLIVHVEVLSLLLNVVNSWQWNLFDLGFLNDKLFCFRTSANNCWCPRQVLLDASHLVVKIAGNTPFIFGIKQKVLYAALIVKLSEKHCNLFVLAWQSILPSMRETFWRLQQVDEQFIHLNAKVWCHNSRRTLFR